eukprot:scaffold578_cov243-Pinguiococcus_pyrenoidosus.AAC.9
MLVLIRRGCVRSKEATKRAGDPRFCSMQLRPLPDNHSLTRSLARSLTHSLAQFIASESIGLAGHVSNLPRQNRVGHGALLGARAVDVVKSGPLLGLPALRHVQLLSKAGEAVHLNDLLARCLHLVNELLLLGVGLPLGATARLQNLRRRRDREVGEDALKGLLDVRADVLHRVVHDHVGAVHLPILGVEPERRVAEVEVGEDVGVAAGQRLGELDLAAERERDVGRDGEVRREAVQLRLPVGRRVAGPAHPGAGDGGSQGPRRVDHGMADDLGEVGVEALDVVAGLDGLDDVEQMRVRAREALAELDQAARQRVGALHGDGDGHRRVRVGHEVAGSVADAGTAEHVHGVVHADAHAIRHLLLHDGRDHGRLLVLVDHRVHEVLGGGHDVRVGAEAGEVLLDALELRDGHLELLADAGVRSHARDRALRRGDGQRRQGDGAALGQAVHEHVPAEAAALLPAHDALHGDEDVLSLDGAVHEGRRQRVVAVADAQAGVVPLEQRDADALVADALEEAIRVLRLEGQAHHASDRREGDVALLEAGAHAELAVLHHHLAAVRHGGGVRAGARAGEAEAGDDFSARELGQEVVLLLLRAVAHEQLARAQRVGHHDGDRGGARAGADLLHHLRVAVSGEAEAAVLLGNDHAEELLLANELPHVRRQVSRPRDLIVVHHRAQLLHLVVHERLLLRAQRHLVLLLQGRQGRLAAEDVSVEANGAGVQRRLLRGADLGHHLHKGPEGEASGAAPQRRVESATAHPSTRLFLSTSTEPKAQTRTEVPTFFAS